MLQVVKFHAPWCGPCKMMAPGFEAVKEEFEGQVEFTEIDVDADEQAAESYGVMSVPTVMVFKDGTLVDEFNGFRPQEFISDFIKKHV